MKKFMLCAAAVAMLGLAACSNKQSEATDTASVTDSADIVVEEVDEVTVDSINPESAQVNVEQTEVVTAQPAEQN